METLFLDMVNISVTASWVIGVVLLLRVLLKPVPKKYVCLLWLVVLFRLLCPVSLETAFSLVPQHQAIRPEIVYTTPQIQTTSPAVNQIVDATVNPVLEATLPVNPQGSVNPLQVYLFIAAWLWVFGMAVLCIYTLVSWYRLRQQLQEAIPAGNSVYHCDRITSPFVFGILHPRIYLPFGLDEEEERWVLLHERSHLARKDFLLKPLFWLAVILHWMNPLVWVAWHFYSRDMELACDEAAIRQLNDNQKWSYSNTLLQLAVRQHLNCPVAFGNNSVKQRIQHVLYHKQVAAGVAAIALVLIVILMAALGTNPVQAQQSEEPVAANIILPQLADQWAMTFKDRDGISRYDMMTPALQQQMDAITLDDNYEDWMPVWVSGEDGGKGMFLRGSSPWPESWQITLQLPETDKRNTTSAPYETTITYDMMDSGQEHYVYEEVLQWQSQGNTWLVSRCDVTVDYLQLEMYEQVQQIYQSVLNGHDTWRLEPEQVALAFIKDYLKQSDGQLQPWDAETQSFIYQLDDGSYDIIMLYQPLTHPSQNAADFWAVARYEYNEQVADGEINCVAYDVRHDLWASLHVAE